MSSSDHRRRCSGCGWPANGPVNWPVAWAFALAVAGAGVVAASGAEPAAPLLRPGGPRSTARLAEIGEDRITWVDEAGTAALAWNEFVAWGWRPESDRGHQLLLAGGSVLVGEILRISATNLAVQTGPLGEVEVPRERVAGVVFRPPPGRLARDRLLQRLFHSERTSERMLLFNGDEREGVAVSGSGPALTSLRIEPADAETAIEDVVAIASRWPGPTVRNSSAPLLWVGWPDGTRLAVTRIQRAGGEQTFRLGSDFTVAARKDGEQPCWLQPQSAPTADRGWVFLSDLNSAGYKHIPWLSGDWPLGIDRNVLGGTLRSAGRGFSKGLGMHSASRLAFDLERQFRWLEAELAMDDLAEGRGAAVFRVFVDRAPPGQDAPWELAFESPMVRGNQPPLPIRVDVSRAERMALVVDFGEWGDAGDYANWLLARLVR